jgi:hypothetical protein
MELLECRSILQHSYAFAFFRFSTSTRRRLSTRRTIEKLSFEHLQSELEMITEQLSNIVARSHIRASKAQIRYLTTASAERRKELSVHLIGVWHDCREKEAARAKAMREAATREVRTNEGLYADVDVDSDDEEDEEEQEIPTQMDTAGAAALGEIDINMNVDTQINDIVDHMIMLRSQAGIDEQGMPIPNDEEDDEDDTDMEFDAVGGDNGDPEDHGDGDVAIEDVVENENGLSPNRRRFLARAEEMQLQEALEASLNRTNPPTHEIGSVSSEGDGEGESWTCSACTFDNASGESCVMCNTPRDL